MIELAPNPTNKTNIQLTKLHHLSLNVVKTHIFFRGFQHQAFQFVQAVVYSGSSHFFHQWFLRLRSKQSLALVIIWPIF